MPPSRIMILGGTRDARELAKALVAKGFPVQSSLAGVTENPVLPEGEVRRGGFGGAEGLARHLKDEKIGLVVDATHPFAARISQNAAEACETAGVPLVRLERPAWAPQEQDRWEFVPNPAKAAAALPGGARAFLTIGRKDILPFLARGDVSGLIRMIEPPGQDLPPQWTLLQARGPFDFAGELQILQQHDITHLVTKNSGGEDTEDKLLAARQLRIPVVMITRPVRPQVTTFTGIAALMSALPRVLSP